MNSNEAAENRLSLNFAIETPEEFFINLKLDLPKEKPFLNADYFTLERVYVLCYFLAMKTLLTLIIPLIINIANTPNTWGMRPSNPEEASRIYQEERSACRRELSKKSLELLQAIAAQISDNVGVQNSLLDHIRTTGRHKIEIADCSYGNCMSHFLKIEKVEVSENCSTLLRRFGEFLGKSPKLCIHAGPFIGYALKVDSWLIPDDCDRVHPEQARIHLIPNTKCEIM